MPFHARTELLKTLRAAPVVLRTLVNGADPIALQRRPAAGEWSAAEVVCHLADTEERALGRVRRMLAEDDPSLPGYDQAALAAERGYADLDPRAELHRYQALRAEHLSLLESLDDAGWRRPGTHAEQGPMTVELYVAHVAGEDIDHLAQISRALSA